MSSVLQKLLASIDKVLASLSFKPAHVTVALSGGLDSVCLLHVAHQWARQHGVRLAAHHVHHGLNPKADAWLDFCASLCQQLDVDFTSTRLTLERKGGESLEACAREARYAALAAHKTDVFLLAQHLDDQMETCFMQLMRGSGPAGLIAMPVVKQADGHVWIRPWLNVPRAELTEVVLDQGWQWVEDDSNQDTRFDRNFWRQTLLPMLESRYPAYRQAVSRTQGLTHEAWLLSEELAQLDWQQCGKGASLDLQPFRLLSAHRAKNLLRYWVTRISGLQPPSSAWFENLLMQLSVVRMDAEIQINLPQDRFFIGVYRHMASLMPRLPVCNEVVLIVSSLVPGVTPVHAWSGRYVLSRRPGEGLSPRIEQAQLSWRPRTGGEKLKLGPKTPSKSLKQHWQEHGVAPWLRQTRPLLYVGEQLAWIPGVGYASDWRADADEEGWVFEWQDGLV
ncbi:tRNA lysidine(34) synthetase TilS [Leeia oryzae]|uniref:tRNA lysidine(34) synthetase TilS n=1 Tax=Leeia oryzae TaxID=356662 RepID=UPI00037769DE|nr:tRNA lysidine(34) synthetase TilS [Leeia oryzae]